MKGKVLKIVGIFILICVLACLFFCYEVKRYTNTHTWATVEVTEEVRKKGYDKPVIDSYTQECLKGDYIDVGGVVLLITNIEHDGTVDFSVKEGTLKDSNDAKIKSDELRLNEKVDYKTDKKSFSLCIVSNRYQ